MMQHVQELIRRNKVSGNEERNYVSVAYKNKVGPERTSWRIIDSIEKREANKGTGADAQRQVEIIKQLKLEIEAKLVKYC
jgi:14-3-3 protein epsilon